MPSHKSVEKCDGRGRSGREAQVEVGGVRGRGVRPRRSLHSQISPRNRLTGQAVGTPDGDSAHVVIVGPSQHQVAIGGADGGDARRRGAQDGEVELTIGNAILVAGQDGKVVGAGGGGDATQFAGEAQREAAGQGAGKQGVVRVAAGDDPDGVGRGFAAVGQRVGGAEDRARRC